MKSWVEKLKPANRSVRDGAGVSGRSGRKPRGKPLIYMLAGAVVVLLSAALMFSGSSRTHESEQAILQANQVAMQLTAAVEAFHRVIEDDQVQSLAAMSLHDGQNLPQLRQYLKGRLTGFRDLRLYPVDFHVLDPASMDGPAYVILDMLFKAEAGKAPLQVIGQGENTDLAGMAAIREEESIIGYLLVTADPAPILSGLGVEEPQMGFIGLEQVQGSFAPRKVKQIGDPGMLGFGTGYRGVAGSLFRVVVPQDVDMSTISSMQKRLLLLLGVLLVVFGVVERWQQSRAPEKEHA
jgi:hypothetical protein